MRLTIYRKLLVVWVPTFLVMVMLGLWSLSKLGGREDSEALALALGSAAGRVAAVLGRQDAAADPTQAYEYLNILASNPAVHCAQVSGPPVNRDGPSTVLARYPADLGCQGVGNGSRLELSVGDEGGTLLVVYDDSSLELAAQKRLWITVGVLAAALAATLASASLGFRWIVGRRLLALHQAMTVRTTGVRPRTLPEQGRDELSEIVQAYNVLLLAEQRRTDDLMARNAKLKREGLHDPLTGLLNRRHFDQWVAHCAAEAAARPQSASLLLVDLDHFKRINDVHGHAVGDQVLRSVATALSEVVRDDDLLVRWGGEEFLVLSLGSSPIDALAARLMYAVSGQPIATSAGPLQVTTSLGAMPLLSLDGPFDAVMGCHLQLVDQALYLAKRYGRARAPSVWMPAVWDPLHLGRPVKMPCMTQSATARFGLMWC